MTVYTAEHTPIDLDIADQAGFDREFAAMFNDPELMHGIGSVALDGADLKPLQDLTPAEVDAEVKRAFDAHDALFTPEQLAAAAAAEVSAEAKVAARYAAAMETAHNTQRLIDEEDEKKKNKKSKFVLAA